jgi:hypothetical protein
MYNSLLKECPSFTLYILCMDETSLSLLQNLHLKNVKLISSVEFEDDRLKAVKKNRTPTEYSWTCAANLCSYMLKRIPERDLITYVDADTYFYNDPEPLFKEIADSSIAIIEHRFTGFRQRFQKYLGRYNVCWVSFRNDPNGIACCEWWKDKVLDWCYAYFKDGMIGDQHYLNDWTEKFQGVHIIRHEGADVAPWNIENHKVVLRNGKICIGQFPLIFYHFHNFSLVSETRFIPITAYFIPKSALKYIYSKYTVALTATIRFIHDKDPQFQFGYKRAKVKSLIARNLFRIRLFAYLYIRYDYYKLKKTARNII